LIKSTELIIPVSRIIAYEITELINFIWNKEEMLEKWKELIIVPIFKKGDKTECSNNIRISQGLISYKHLPNILL